jgi:DNA repair protein RadD
MPAQTLRDFQATGLQQVKDSFREGARSLLFVLPTGGGKTTCFTKLIAELAEAGLPSLILVHRRELASQACNRLREFGVSYGLIMAGEQPMPYARVQVASVQTLVRRKCPPAKLVVCDEAHLSTAKTWQTILANYPNARVLGCTATPWRLSGKPLVGAYDRVIVVATPAELREQGHLCPYVGFSYKTPDLSDVKTTAGDYNEKQAAAAMGQSLIVDNVVEEWLKHASQLSTVVFAVTVEHSKQLTTRFKAAGVNAEHLDGSTGLEERKAILARVERGITRVLCNVGVAVEGLDIPRLKCCVLARPTKSLARAIQMMGRVRRPWNGVTARIHDHAFVIEQHGLPDAERDYTLSAKLADPPTVTRCESCFCNYNGRKCPNCDRENEPKIVGERLLNTVPDAEKVEFDSASEAAPTLPPVDIKWNSPGRKVKGRLVKRWDEPADWGTRRVYLVKGKRDYHLPGTTRLNRLLDQVSDSELVEIEYVGDTALPDGRTRKEFKVAADDGT